LVHVSPTMLRLRLGRELARARDEAGLNQQQMARLCAISPQGMSQVEAGHRSVSVATVQHTLSKMPVGQDRWHQLSVLATQATTPGWWTSWGQAFSPADQLAIDLESGARRIRQFGLVEIPTLLRTDDHILSRAALAHPGGADPDRVVRAHQARRAMLGATSDSVREVIISDTALRRASAPPDVLAAQYRHLATPADSDGPIRLRVLPDSTPLRGYFLPRQLHVHNYPDDPPLAVTDDTGPRLYAVEADVVRTGSSTTCSTRPDSTPTTPPPSSADSPNPHDV
jgi:transcriptional regulator with XRE-family HTH domain